MIKISLSAVKAFAIDATALISSKATEDALRHLFSARLPLMFPDDTWWIREHSIGVEKHVHYIDAIGKMRSGFIDSLVGKTAIEYEKNLSLKSIYDEGYHQLEEYCSALLNQGIPCNDIIGVLSDTVHWYAFHVYIKTEVTAGLPYGPQHIALHEIESINLENQNDDVLNKFGLFINRYLGREGSRNLNSTSLTIDLGFNSNFFKEYINGLRTIVNEAFSTREHYGKMIASLWQSFVIRFEHEGANVFNKDSYTNELYIMTLAKLLCANILNGVVINDEMNEIENILNGQWFKERGFVNLVEFDYFGWFCEPPLIGKLLKIARKMQNDLAAYDYKDVTQQDLFGGIMAQLADKDRRLLLGQEFTPQWLAKKIVTHAINLLPDKEYPKFIDMCCGSGVFVVETLKQTMDKYNIRPSHCSKNALHALVNCVVGFDIDPLAVLLARLNWAMIMREFSFISQAEMVIPIYHADSLFMTAPLTRVLNSDYETQNIQLVFDGDKVVFPGFLISPNNRTLFDIYIQSSYDIAKARAGDTNADSKYMRSQAETLVTRITRDTGVTLNLEQHNALLDSCWRLIPTLEKLQRNGRNGIWPFLLGNSYRPGLVREQFNAIVSNPPWMAMSKLANNPYKGDIIAKAENYGIKPMGSSHLHTELATVFLLNSIDNYLKENAYCGVVLPDTLLNGYHHEPFRKQEYLHSDWPVYFKMSEIWELPKDTFKNKAIVVFGQKVNEVNSNMLTGKRVFSSKSDKLINFQIIRQGKRTAWSSNLNVQDNKECIVEKMRFLEGADIMPRTLVFHKTSRQTNGKWSLLPIPRQHDELSYLVNGAKKSVNFTLNVQNVDDQFMYECYMSNHLLPFMICKPAMAFLPMKRNENGFTAVEECDIATYGSATMAAFTRIFNETGENSIQYFNRVNMRNKLNPQTFDNLPENAQLVLTGASGGYTCAAYMPISKINHEKTIIDQTLYWYIAQSDDEANYICALLNSCILNEIISDFQPVGVMGKRHIHTLPYAVTPSFNPHNAKHIFVVEKARILRKLIEREINSSKAAHYISPSQHTLQLRRSKIREFINSFPESKDCENACRSVYDDIRLST